MMKRKIFNRLNSTTFLLVLLSLFLLETTSFAAGRRGSSKRVGSASLVKGHRVAVTAVGAISTAENEEEHNCKASYVDCMDALIPYIVERNEFLKKDKTTKGFLKNDTELRCVYDDSNVDLNGNVMVEDTAVSGSAISFGSSSSSSSSESTLSRMSTLYRNYNFYCDEASEGDDEFKCNYSKTAASNHYAGEKSSAYFSALSEQIESGNLNLANFNDGVLADLGIDVAGAKKSAKDKDGNATDYGFAISAAPPSFSLDAAGEFAMANEICMSGKSVKDLKKKKLLNDVLGASGVESLVENIETLSSDDCKSSKMISNIQNFYRFGNWNQTREEGCNAENYTWNADEEKCIDKDEKTFYPQESLSDENWMTPAKSCDQYEIALQSHRIEVKSNVQAMLVAKAEEIENAIKRKEIDNLNESVEINNEIAQLQNSFFKTCADTFNGCMLETCGEDDIYEGQYSGCVDFDGPKSEKLLSGGMMCYPEFKICVENVAKTINKDRVSPYLQEWLRELNDHEYQNMAVDIVAENIGQTYKQMLKASCEESGGYFENQFCFVKAIFTSDTIKKTSGGNWWKGKSKSSKEESFKKTYFAIPGADFTCKDKSYSHSKKKGARGPVLGIAAGTALVAASIVTFGGAAVIVAGSAAVAAGTTTGTLLTAGLIAGGVTVGATAVGAGVAVGGMTATKLANGNVNVHETVGIIKKLDGVETMENGCGKLFFPNNWGDYLSYLYSTENVTYGIHKNPLIAEYEGHKFLNIFTMVPICMDGDCNHKLPKLGIVKDPIKLSFYDVDEVELTPKKFMADKTIKMIAGEDGQVGTGDDGWDVIFKDKD